MICPKCRHERSDNDDPLIPDYQCPACGIIYAKYKPLDEQGKEIANNVTENVKKAGRQMKPAVFRVDESTSHTLPPSNKTSNQQETIIEGQVVIPLFTKRLKLIAACGLILVVMAKSYISPATFMSDFREALFKKNASDLTEYIDFEKLKINTKATLKTEITQTTQQANNPFFQIGMAWGNQMIDAMIDNIMSPEGIKAMFNSHLKDHKQPEGTSVFDFHYVDFNRAIVDMGGIAIALDRTGFFSWVIVAFDKNLKDSVSVPNELINNHENEVKEAVTDIEKLQQHDITAAIDLFKLDNGRYPSTEEGLRALVIAPNGAHYWRGPYIEPEDASFLNEFTYRCCPYSLERTTYP
jgi:hypothetical protein